MVYTTSFASLPRIRAERLAIVPVSIAPTPPPDGPNAVPHLPQFAPPPHVSPAAPELYIREYRRLLARLDPCRELESLSAIARHVVLVCHCDPAALCHRRLVAEWLEEAFGHPVPELFCAAPHSHARSPLHPERPDC